MICPLPASFLSSPSSSHCTLPYVSSCCLLCCACFAVGSPPPPPGHHFPHRHVLGHCLHHLPHRRPSTPSPDPPLGSRPHLACTIIVSFSFSPPLLCPVSSSLATTSPLCIEFRTPRYLSTISLRYHALLTVSLTLSPTLLAHPHPPASPCWYGRCLLYTFPVFAPLDCGCVPWRIFGWEVVDPSCPLEDIRHCSRLRTRHRRPCSLSTYPYPYSHCVCY